MARRGKCEVCKTIYPSNIARESNKGVFLGISLENESLFVVVLIQESTEIDMVVQGNPNFKGRRTTAKRMTEGRPK